MLDVTAVFQPDDGRHGGLPGAALASVAYSLDGDRLVQFALSYWEAFSLTAGSGVLQPDLSAEVPAGACVDDDAATAVAKPGVSMKC